MWTRALRLPSVLVTIRGEDMSYCIECKEKLRNLGIIIEAFNAVDYTNVYVCDYPKCKRYGLVSVVVSPNPAS